MARRVSFLCFLWGISALFFISIINIQAQTQESFYAELTSVESGSKTVPQNEWDNLKIYSGSQLVVNFKTSGVSSEQIFYRVFLDGNILETKLLNASFTFDNLSKGLHILRIIPVTLGGDVGKPLVLSFTVIDQPVQSGQTKDETKGGFLTNPVFVYALIGLVIGLLGVIIILIKKANGNEEEEKIVDHALQELSELKHSHKRMLDELKNKNEENEYLRIKIKELDQNINMLENANVHLIQQKEKLVETKRKLEILQTQKEELFTIAVHDIKNPASAIQSYIQLLNSYDLNANEQHEIMTSIMASSENIVKLSHNMCDIIAKSMPEPKIQLLNASLSQIIDSVFNQNFSYAKTKKVKLFNKSSRDLPESKIDAEKIEEALDNLVNNAIKYAPQNTIVEIQAYLKQTDKKTLVVLVKDNGVGLSEDDQKKCFQKGMKLTPTPTGLEQSSGLGLWIVKRIIDEHDGKVWVESKLNAGSTFGFELPIENLVG